MLLTPNFLKSQANTLDNQISNKKAWLIPQIDQISLLDTAGGDLNVAESEAGTGVLES